MKLHQLKYVVKVATTGNISQAAKQLYISQPSLTAAIKDLEKELNITIFIRSHRGVLLTPEGEEFLGYARQVIEQTDLIEEKYLDKEPSKHLFCVSAQHYSFVVEAFVDLIEQYDSDRYDFHIRETQTYDIIEDVAKMRSDIGVLYLNGFNETVLRKAFKDNHLQFTRLFVTKPHVFIGANNPLASQDSVTLDDLTPYPRLSYEQGEHNAFYYSEEILSTREVQKDIYVCDRATLFNLVIGLNGYTICSGVINAELNGENIIAKPLMVDDYMEIGYITREKVTPSHYAKLYIEALKKYTQGFDENIK